MRRSKYTYIPKDEISEVITFNNVSFESDDLLDGAYVKGRKKYDDGGYMAKGGDVKVVLDEGNGKVINQLYNQWNNVKNQNQYDKWVTKVKNTRFGTYGTISIEEVLEKFDFDNAPINSFHLNTFKKELKSALKKMEDGGYMAKGGMSYSDQMIVIMNAQRDISVEQQAQDLIGATWYEIDEETRAGVISEMISSGIIQYAEGGAVAQKFAVKYTLEGGKKVEKTYESKDEMEEGIANFYLANDVEDVEVVEEKEKPKKKGFFDKEEDKKKPSSKSKIPDIQVRGIESEIADYNTVQNNIKKLLAEKEIIADVIKQVGKDTYLALYEESGRNPDTLNLVCGDESIMYMTQDKYLMVQPEKEAMLEEYGDLLSVEVKYELDKTILDKKAKSGETNGDILSDLILNSTEISDEDKKKLLKVTRKVTIKKGSIDRLMDYDNPEEIYTLIQPITGLRSVGE